METIAVPELDDPALYRHTLEELKKDFEALDPAAKKITTRMTNLKKAIQALSALLGEEIDEQHEFTPMRRR